MLKEKYLATTMMLTFSDFLSLSLSKCTYTDISPTCMYDYSMEIKTYVSYLITTFNEFQENAHETIIIMMLTMFDVNRILL